MTTPDLEVVLARMWVSFRPLAQSRVEALEVYATALGSAGDAEPLRPDAASAAHKLAGALGSYGRPGSDEASQLELLLRASVPTADHGAVAELVRQLRTAVDA